MIRRLIGPSNVFGAFIRASPAAVSSRQKARHAKYRRIIRDAMDCIARPGLVLPCEGRTLAAERQAEAIAKAEAAQEPANELSPTEMYAMANAMYTGSPDVKQDKVEAFSLWSKAALAGHKSAAYSKACMLRAGDLGEPDLKGAFETFTELATDRNPEGQFGLATMLYSGEAAAVGHPQDLTRARLLFSAAAHEGFVPAITRVAYMMANGLGGDKREKDAAKLYEVAAAAGDPEACFTLGCYYMDGSAGVSVDKEKGFQLNLQAARVGMAVAIHNVGAFYLEGTGVEKDPKEAAKYFQQAGDMGVVMSILNLAKMYTKGIGVETDVKRAFKLCAQALQFDEDLTDEERKPEEQAAVDALVQSLQTATDEDVQQLMEQYKDSDQETSGSANLKPAPDNGAKSG